METQIETLRKAAEGSSHDVPTLLMLARSFEDALAFPDARAVYERVLDQDEGNVDARLGLARVLFLGGSISEAAVRVEALVGDAPENAEAHLFLARILVSENDRSGAVRAFHLAKALNPRLSDPSLERELGEAARMESEEGGSDSEGGDGWPSGGKACSPFELDDGMAGGGGAEGDLERKYDDGGFFEAMASGLERSGFSLANFEQPHESFRDVGGLDSLKEAMRLSLLYPLRNEELFRAYGREAGGSILLYGPPGCGKTTVARAAAGEVDAGFLSVQVHQVLDRCPGVSERNLHEVFELGRAQAPAVLVFDDFEALATDREHGGDSGPGSGLANQFLGELDRMERDSGGLLVVCATSAPWKLDPAFRRPGRFQQSHFVGLPNREERGDILRVLSRSKPLVEIDAAKIATRTAGFTGGELKAMIEYAAQEALLEALSLGRVVPLDTRRMLDAARRISPAASVWFDRVRGHLPERHRRTGIGRLDILAHLR